MLWMFAMAAASGVGGAGPSVSTFSVTGEGSWEVNCHIVGGDQEAFILNTSQRSISVRDLKKASCEVRNARKAPLVISIVAPTVTCPVELSGAGTCEQTFEKGRSATFKLAQKSNG